MSTPAVKEKKPTIVNPMIHGDLPLEVVKACEQIKDWIADIRRKISSGQPVPPGEFFELSAAIISFRTWLIDYLMEWEARYRDKMELFRSKNMSVAASEVKAKTTPEYRGYKYLDRFDEVAQEMVLLTKKFQEKMTDDGRM